MAEKLKGLLDSAKARLTGLLGDFPEAFDKGTIYGALGQGGDLAYQADTARRALMLQRWQPLPEDYVGTSENIAKQAGYTVPQSISGQLGWLAGNVMSPGISDIGKIGGTAAMFLGAKAKTAMPDVLEYAQAMEAAGKSADEIWQTTGKLGQPWFKGADGKWRFEISDKGRLTSDSAKAALADTTGDIRPVSELLGADDEIAQAYPDIGNILFESVPGGSGTYYPANKFGTEKIEAGARGGRSTALHEIMHPIQVREGFALGGMPANSSKKAEQEYFRLAAEAEARNVQHRADLTMDERIALPPWVTQDVPTEQQIVRFGDGPAMAIPFWHGSPHKFDAFDLSHMGKGEGAQAYGWGAYGAESPEVAKQYLNVDPSVPVPPRRQFMGQDLEPGTPEYHAARLASEGKESLAGLRKLVAGWISDARPGEPTDGYQKTLEILNQAQKKSDFKQLKPEPYLYRGEYRWPDPAKEAATPLTGEDLLQWDRPLSEQPEGVRKALRENGISGKKIQVAVIGDGPEGYKNDRYVFDSATEARQLEKQMREAGYYVKPYIGPGDETGESFYRSLSRRYDGDDAASQQLQAIGIPGIRYLDGQSRPYMDATTRVVEDGGKWFGEVRNPDTSTHYSGTQLSDYFDTKAEAEAWVKKTLGEPTHNLVMFSDKGIKLLERNGAKLGREPITAYHKTDAEFTEFDPAFFGKNDNGYAGRGVYLTPKPLPGFTYGKDTLKVSAALENPYIRTKDSWNTDPLDPYSWIPNRTQELGGKPEHRTQASEEWTQMMRGKGHDGFIDEATDGGEIVVFDPKQAKILERNGTPIEDFAARRAGKAKPYREAANPDYKAMLGNEYFRDPATGEPAMIYHGTEKTIKGPLRRSKTGAMGPAVYFGDAEEVAKSYAGDSKKAKIIKAYAKGKYLNNMQWSEYIQKHGWGGAEEAAKADGWAGVHDTKFENAVAVWNPDNIVRVE